MNELLIKHLTKAELEAGMDYVSQSPQDNGSVEMIVARPETLERTVLEAGEFTLADGLVGDNWSTRGSRHTDDGSAHPDMQITLMNSRYLDLIADGNRERWALAGDQLIVDLDLGTSNLVTGDQLRIGEVIFEVTPAPHNGCVKFKERFGLDVTRFTGSDKSLRLRGIYVKVIEPGTVRRGGTIQKI